MMINSLMLLLLEPLSFMAFNASTGSATDNTEKLTAKEIWERFEKVKKEQGLE